ncbi:MAG: ATP-grasp domain-containing protein, partial [Chloroflexota bacterium]
MLSDGRPIMLCMSSEFKGMPLLVGAKRLGCHVILLTKEKWKNEDWPRESIDELFFMPDLSKRQDVLNAVSYLARTRPIDRIFPLDDFDGEMAAALREHLRMPGLGETAIRFFRDKLAMRMQARAHGLNVPEFVGVINYDRVREFMRHVPPPWVLKPRGSAGAMGIKRIEREEELWQWLDRLGDEQSNFLLEQFVPGDVFHVDSIVSERKVVFSVAHQYGRPPLTVSHGGGVFTTRTMRHDDELTQALLELNRQTIAALGMVRGVNHIEYIQAHADGRLHFLEAAARVGGANIADMVEFATGINLWHEWPRIEAMQVRGEPYVLPPTREGYAGILQCLAHQEHPDFSAYNEPEVVWRSDKKYHAGMIVASPDPQRIESLLASYSERFARDFLAVLPP